MVQVPVSQFSRYVARVGTNVTSALRLLFRGLLSYHRVDGQIEAGFSATLPIHLRYQEPSSSSTHRLVAIPPPLFYARCGSASEAQQPMRPWTRIDFTSESSPLELRVPVGQKRMQGLVTVATLAATVLGAAVILLAILWRDRSGGDHTKAD